MIEQVHAGARLLAIIVRSGFSAPGVTFVTPAELSQQLAYIQHRAGHTIDAHVHNPVAREVQSTRETLFIKRGRLRVDFYHDDRTYIESRVVGPGDVILLVQGGHGFEVLEDLEMFEVKQGPYAGDQDKTVFPAARPDTIKSGDRSAD